jgi:hypothetical protein
MKPLSKSPQRYTFQKEGYVNRMKEKGEELNEEYLEYFEKVIQDHNQKFDDPKSRVNNMEYDLLTTEWILEKARVSESYAQNLYAAMCNNEFVTKEMWPLLRMDPAKDFWGCSWRYAGGIIADMRQEGDYIDWYCSGIRDIFHGENDTTNFTKAQLDRLEITERYVPEGKITEEIEEDLNKLGWIPAPGGDWENFN